MLHRRIPTVPALSLLVLLLCAAPVLADDSDIRLKGFAEVPGTGLTLPLPPGAVATIVVTFGVPATSIPVQVTSDTKVKSKSGSVLLADGDAVKVRATVVGNVLRASRLELQDFPELELVGVVSDVPAAGVALPLAPGATLDFVLTLGTSGIEVPVRLTSASKINDVRTLRNGDLVRVEALVRGGVVVVTKLKSGGDEDEEDD